MTHRSRIMIVVAVLMIGAMAANTANRMRQTTYNEGATPARSTRHQMEDFAHALGESLYRHEAVPDSLMEAADHIEAQIGPAIITGASTVLQMLRRP